MEISGEGLDAVLIKLYRAFLAKPGHNEGSRGPNAEIPAVLLRITKPRARLSRSENRGHPFSALGELLWYLARSDKLDFIEPYVPRYKNDADNGVLFGAYGPRIFSMRGRVDQLSSVTTLLRAKPGSRRAVVQLFNAEDIETHHTEVPCTTTLQFFIREKEKHLHLSVSMRSNDAYFGLPHDVFCFTMLQEMMARRLGVKLGEYYHYAGSMHVYDEYPGKLKGVDLLKEYLAEGHQRPVEMPAMPCANPFELVPKLLDVENKARNGERVVASDMFPDDYWADIARLIQVFWASRRKENFDVLSAEFTAPIYRTYVESRRNVKRRNPSNRK